MNSRCTLIAELQKCCKVSCQGIVVLVLPPVCVVFSQSPPDLPDRLLLRSDARYEGPYRAYPDRIVYRRPTVRICPGPIENSVLDAGVLLELRNYTNITGLWLYAGPMISDASSDAFVVDIRPGAIDDIGELTHLESLSIRKVDLTQGQGLRFLESLSNLRELEFVDCQVELSDVLEHLPACKHLTSIRISYVPRSDSDDEPERRRVISGNQIDKLVQDSELLATVFISTTEQYEPAAIQRFSDLKSLNILHITYCYHRWDANDGLVVAQKPPTVPEQHQTVKELESYFQAKGMRSWFGPRFELTYSLPACIIRAPGTESEPE